MVLLFLSKHKIKVKESILHHPMSDAGGAERAERGNPPEERHFVKLKKHEELGMQGAWESYSLLI